MRSDSVVFINDLESDRQYSGWPKSLKQFLQPMFPGSLRQVARNAFNLVFCFDPASLEGEELAEYITLFLENLVPVRLGVVLVSAADTGEEVGMVLTRGFYYIAENYSGRQALKWLLKVQSSMSVEAARVAMETEFPDAPLDVLEESSTHTMEAAAFFKGTGLRLLPQVLLNGVLLDLEEDLEAAIVGQLQQQTFLLQRWIYMKKITDSTDLYEYFMNRPNVLKRLNHHVTASGSLQLDLSASLSQPIPDLMDFRSFSVHSMSALLAHRMTYYTSQNDEFAVRPLSVWIVADLSSVQGRTVTLNALSYLEENSRVQFGVLHNPSCPRGSSLARAVVAAEMNGWASVGQLLSLLSSPPDHPLAALRDAHESDVTDDAELDSVLAAHIIYCRHVLGLQGGQTALLANGRVSHCEVYHYHILVIWSNSGCGLTGCAFIFHTTVDWSTGRGGELLSRRLCHACPAGELLSRSCRGGGTRERDGHRHIP
jgi:UDP-glucose:glycoprotein glucosyltransferase